MLNKKRFFIIGIKGMAMANIALFLKKMGKEVSGSDISEEFTTDELLKKAKIRIINDFDPKKLPKVDIVIYSAAHHGKQNPQLCEAIKRKIKIVHQIEFMSEIMSKFPFSYAVAGCHGKTTTSSLLAYAMIKLGLNPSYIIGTSSFDDYAGGDMQNGKHFVIEADEYGMDPPDDKTPKLLFLNPTNALITNIDFDHPDVYNNIEHTKDVFVQFCENVISRGKKPCLFLCIDDENINSIIPRLIPDTYKTYGFSENADMRVLSYGTNQKYMNIELAYKGKPIGEIQVSLFGEKNALNVAGVILMLLHSDFSIKEIQDAILNFKGAKRRFEEIAYENDIYLVDDYAHHPHEIDAIIGALHTRFPQRRLILIFQPHTFSRTFSLKNEFVHSLSKADIVLLMPIFPSAREDASYSPISSEDLVKISHDYDISNIYAVSSEKHCIEMLRFQIHKGDVVVTLGAGNVYKLGHEIIEVMKMAF